LMLKKKTFFFSTHTLHPKATNPNKSEAIFIIGVLLTQ
jgi:hypothetical protein